MWRNCFAVFFGNWLIIIILLKILKFKKVKIKKKFNFVCAFGCMDIYLPIVVWTLPQLPGYEAHGRSFPANMKGFFKTCRIFLTLHATWPNIATSWAAKVCTSQQFLSFLWLRKTWHSCMKVRICKIFQNTFWSRHLQLHQTKCLTWT